MRMIPTSALVLAAVVVLPLVSLLVDLALLEVARSRQRITSLTKTLADEPMPPPRHQPNHDASQHGHPDRWCRDAGPTRRSRPGGARAGGQVERRLPGRRFRPNPKQLAGSGDPPRLDPASSGHGGHALFDGADEIEEHQRPLPSPESTSLAQLQA
jgi:hypothetical protein